MSKLKKRNDGRYVRQIYLGKDDDGRRKYKNVFGKTQTEANTKANALKAQIDKGIDIGASLETFEAWKNRFLQAKRMEGIGKSHELNLENFSKHLAVLDSIPLEKITVVQIQDIINRRAAWGDGEKPLSKRTLTGIKQTASQIFKLAMASRAVEYNPAEYVKIPKTATETHRTAISKEQRNWIDETPHRAQRAAMLMLYAGLRRGEMLALTWADVECKANVIHVTKSLELAGNQRNVKSPKTAAGTRDVVMPSNLRLFLEAEKATDNCLYIVHTRDGKTLSQSAWTALWKSYLSDLNVKYGYHGEANKYAVREKTGGMERGALPMLIKTFTPHQLRHTYATMLYEAGVDVLTARNQLGHSDIETTLGIYTHLDKNYQVSSMEKFAQYLDASRVQVSEKEI